MIHRVVAVALCSLLQAVMAPAQVRVKLQDSRVGRSPLHEAIGQLSVAEHRHQAMMTLWAAGQPAVPLLAGVVGRGGPAGTAALLVLERLGGEAAAAAPVLLRAAQAAAADPPWRARLQAVAAKVAGPPVILAPFFFDGVLVELDFDGKELRRLSCEQAWHAWPLPGDNVAVVSYTKGCIVESTWAGIELRSDEVKEQLSRCIWLEDGDRIITSWHEPQGMTRLAPDGSVRWHLDVPAVCCERAFDDELAVLIRDDKELRYVSLDGKVLRATRLPQPCGTFQLLPGGGVLLGTAHTIMELGPGGEVVAEMAVEGVPVALARLRDGRIVVALDKGVALLAADGTELWRHEGNYCGQLFVREPLSGGR